MSGAGFPAVDPSKGPPFDLPMRHFAAAAAAFWVFAAGFAWGTDRFLDFDFRAKWVLGLVHVLTLGWLTMSILGAATQLSAVLWETPLAWPGAARAAWWGLVVGLTGFVGELWIGGDRYWVPAVLLVGSVSVYLACFARTMLRAPRLDWTARHLAVSFSALAAVVVLGLMLAWDRQRGVLFHDPRGALIAHLHLALVGWASLSIVGVSYRLVAMFALSHVESKTPGRLALALGVAGLAGLALDGLFFGRRLLPLWAVLLAAAYASYAWQMRRLFSARHRRIDPALAFTLLALTGGAAWAALGTALAFGLLPDDTNFVAAYLFSALVGWVTPFILGQAHKIVPFLVWLRLFARGAWGPGVVPPKMTELASERAAWAEFAALAFAVALGVPAFLRESPALLRAAAACLLAAATLYAGGVAYTLSFLVREVPWKP